MSGRPEFIAPKRSRLRTRDCDFCDEKVASKIVAGLPESAVELQELVTELLGRFGVAGTVAIEGGRATLFGSGPTVEIDVGPSLSDWGQLGDDVRRKRAVDVARRLAGERRRTAAPSRASGGRRLSTWLVLAALGMVAIGLGRP